MSDILRAEFRVAVEIDGKEFEATHYDDEFALDTIPRARVVLAVGRNARDGKTAAKIHKEISNFPPMSVVKVYLCASGEWSKNADWPAGRHKIFDGKMAGIGWQKNNGKVQLVAYLQHWLIDLNSSSALTPQSHVANPAQYTFGATLAQKDQTGLGGGKSRPMGLSQTALGASLKNSNAFKDDLWGGILKPLLCSMAESSHLQMAKELKACFGNDGKEGLQKNRNDHALAALKRIEGVSWKGKSACDLKHSCYNEKLSMVWANGKLAVEQSVLNCITQAIMRDSIASYANNTLWGKLIQFAGTFRFRVVPLVDHALVVPVIGGLQDTYCKQIVACDYKHIALRGTLKKPLRGVAIWSAMGSQTNIGQGDDKTPVTKMGVGGCFSPDPPPDDGMIFMATAPIWMANIPSAGMKAGKTMGLTNKKAHSGSTLPKEEKEDALKGDPDGATKEGRYEEAAEMNDNYAHALYVQQSLSGRAGRISGKLRFDISPGSSVKIEGSAERFLTGADQLGQDVYGTVVQLKNVIDADRAKAGTTLAFSNIRTEAENKSDRTSVPAHPLYTTKFLGAPMVDALQFKDEGNGCCDEGGGGGEGGGGDAGGDVQDRADGPTAAERRIIFLQD
jgi:hypothetical protein